MTFRAGIGGTARYEQTKQELDHLVWAITGNPEVYTDGA
jgi:hypothetical protein